MTAPSRFFSKAVLSAGVLALVTSTGQTDSLWSPEFKVSLVADKKATSVGDIITVVVQESNTTKKDSNTKTSKTSSLDASLTTFLYPPSARGFMTRNGKLPAMAMTSDNQFDGGGSIGNSASVVARFGVRVVDVLPNGNLIIEGMRQTTFSGESQTVILRATVRQYDVTPSNTVYSYNLADMSIKFVDSGAISNSQKKGWFNKAWDVLTPF